MLRVMRNHRRAAHGECRRLRGAVHRARTARRLASLRDGASHRHPRQGRLGQAPSRSASNHGYRNAQTTVVAPTGTIGLVMDCDTTGIEPDFALVKFKKLAGGGYFKIINRAVPEALRALGYREATSPRSRPMPSATARCANRARNQRHATLRAKGFTEAKPLEELEKTLAGAFDIKFVFNKWTVRR